MIFWNDPENPEKRWQKIPDTSEMKLPKRALPLKSAAIPIVPIMLGDAKLAQEMAAKLLDDGVYAVGFFYPVVPKGQARIRVQISAAHSRDDLEFALEKFVKAGKELEVV